MSRVRNHFEEAQQVLDQFLSNEEQLGHIDQAVEAMANCLKSGHKIIACGNGGSHCDAMHFAEELSGRYRNNRKALAAMAISDPSHLSCVGNDYGYEYVFSRYVEALGRPGDILLGISTSGNSQNILHAIAAAKQAGMTCIGLTGKDGGKMKSELDIEIRAPFSEFADRAQEIHIKVIHAMIDGIENSLELS
jgi:D-sedoheptulose 7-phosphate isomerase